jgi:hypothetical protein
MKIQSYFDKLKNLYINFNFLVEARKKEYYELDLDAHPLLVRPYKLFSQSDEDGISLSILKRIGFDVSKSFSIEFGVQDGLETNTMILRSLGSKLYWVGNENLVVKQSPNLIYKKGWVDLDNIKFIFSEICSNEDRSLLCVSMDLDGNDYHFLSAILSTDYRPAWFTVEINPSFGDEIEYIMPYSKEHNWSGGNFFGASLSSYIDLFKSYDYTLIVVNRSGINAFFLDNKYLDGFEDCINWMSKYGLMKHPPLLPMLSIHLGHPMTKEMVQYFIDK